MLPFEQVLTRQKKQLTYDITDDITLKGNESSIRELISILIDNAAKYCEESGTVHVELHTVNSKIRLAITNDFPDVENCLIFLLSSTDSTGLTNLGSLTVAMDWDCPLPKIS